MSEMIRWVEEHFDDVPPTPPLVIDATKHMRKNERKQLFSDDLAQMKTAEGGGSRASATNGCCGWSSGPTSSAASPARARTHRPSARTRRWPERLLLLQHRRHQDSGNGQDLAEFDLLLRDADGNLAFAEIVTSPTDMKEFEAEIRFKKRLIGFVYGQAQVPFCSTPRSTSRATRS